MKSSTKGDLSCLNQRELADHLGDLKMGLVEMVSDRWPELVVAARARAAVEGLGYEGGIDLLDSLIYGWHFDDGRSPIEVFADEDPGLTEEERAILREGKRAYYSWFDLLSRDGRKLMLQDLKTGEQVTAWLNKDLGHDLLTAGCLFGTRLVPMRGDYMVAGVQQCYPPSDRKQVLREWRYGGRISAARKKWEPALGKVPPTLSSLCPCGSGRRYKKCCRPR